MLLARLLIAGLFVVMGGYRLAQAADGAPTPNSVLVLSAVELVLGLLLASGWKLRAVAALAGLFLLAEALLSYRFWGFSGAEQGARLLHFMKNLGLAGGLVLLWIEAGVRHRR